MQFQDHEPPKLPLRFTPPSCTHLRGHYSSGRDISEVFCFKQTQKGRSTALVRIVWLCAPFSFSGPKHNFNMNGMYPLDSSILSALPPPSMQITLTKATCLKDLICRPNTKVDVLKDHVKSWNTAKSSASLLSRMLQVATSSLAYCILVPFEKKSISSSVAAVYPSSPTFSD